MCARRKSLRHPYHDYHQSGAYFVTIVTQDRSPRFGKICDAQMQLNPAGHMVSKEWQKLSARFADLMLGEFVVMPNHVHGILMLGIIQRNEEHVLLEQTNTLLGRMIGAFKSSSTTEYIHRVKQHGWEPFNRRLWQRNYYERVIRNENEFDRIREYVLTNAARWNKDGENVHREGIDDFDKWLNEL